MEALALLGGILAVVQAGDRLKELLHQIRPFFDAPNDIDCLVKEVSQLEDVLKDLRNCVAEIESEFIPDYGDRCENLQTVIQEGRGALGELEELMSSSFTRSTCHEGQQKLSRFGRISWVRKQEKVQKIRKRLQDVRMTILVQLGCFQMMWYRKLQKSIDHLGFSMASNLSQNTGIQTLISHRFDELANMLRISPSPLTPDRLKHEIVPNDRIVLLEQEPIREVRDSYTPMPHLMSLRARVERYYQCKHSCCCSCHRKKGLKSPAVLNEIIGSLDVHFASISPGGSVCDLQECSNRKKSIASANYRFPKWFLSRAIFFNLISSRSTGPELLLRVSKIIPCDSPIFLCIARNDLAGVQRLFQNGQASAFDMDEKWKMTPLIKATSGRDTIEIIKYLLSMGADPMHADSLGCSMHRIAWFRMLQNDSCLTNRYHELRSLIPEIDASQSTGFTTLHKIVLGQHGGSLEDEVRKAQYSIDSQDNWWGMTPLSWAAHRGDLSALTELLHLGADPNFGSVDVPKPIGCAINGGHVACVLELMNHIDVLADVGDSPIMRIARSRHGLKLCLPLPAIGISTIDGNRHQNSRQSIAGFHSSCLERMIQAGVDINAIDSQCMSALLWAIRSDDYRVIDHLLRRGADFLYRRDHLTLLHFAADVAGVETLRVLNSHKLKGLDVNAKCANGLTALDFAERRGDPSIEWLAAWTELIERLLTLDEEQEERCAAEHQDTTMPEKSEVPDGVEGDEDEDVFENALATQEEQTSEQWRALGYGNN